MLPLAVESAESDHFARSDRKIDSSEASRPAEIPDNECRRAIRRLRRLGWKYAFVFTSNHHLNDRVVALRPSLEGRDVAAVAEYCAVVRELRNLMHSMRNVDDRETFRTKLFKHAKNSFNVGGCKRRGRLVEDQDFRAARKGFSYFNHLPARQGQILRERG